MSGSLAVDVFGPTQELYRTTGILNQPRQHLLQLHPGQAQRLGHGQERLTFTERQVDGQRPAVGLAGGNGRSAQPMHSGHSDTDNDMNAHEDRQLHAVAGDWLEVAGLPGRPARRGQVLEVLGRRGHEHYRVRWDEAHETVHYPAQGTRLLRQAPDGMLQLTPLTGLSVTGAGP